MNRGEAARQFRESLRGQYKSWSPQARKQEHARLTNCIDRLFTKREILTEVICETAMPQPAATAESK